MKRMKGKKMKIFKNEGSVRDTELKIVNFRPSSQSVVGASLRDNTSKSSQQELVVLQVVLLPFQFQRLRKVTSMRASREKMMRRERMMRRR